MKENGITIREFSGENINFRTNDDLPMQLHKGENTTGTFVDAVLVKINVDECECNDVEVYTHDNQADADIIDAAIESLIVIRDALRSMSGAAA